ncbi:pimeloyl-ACP methyl ester carboxylesterase [Scopulibacillus darangshiensis]|uniref:Pimeloyl-ACP methyl ester carboxylesterase n=1 Tax=Scopulibacillus darangshiensis TaxID=442528 RepID=A0A4R2P429_9BACL|nr:alpha/beta hydrolase [Scopulibacillus darangshiensis]TCP29387.1 pimeloyl-ACP methyl ester carboxylesterase [Scopulibacillus darangshiensis]
MPYCQVKKANIYYEEYGIGKPIIMIHGFTPDHRLMTGCMEPVFKERKGWRRIYIDLPGMGQTKDYEQINNTDEMLDAVLDLIDTLIPNQTFLIAGESYGGYLTRGIIAKHHEQVEGVVLICPMILPEKEDRTLPNHYIIEKDDDFLSHLTKEEAEDFSSMHVILNEYIWHRYQDEILSGCKIADEAFLSKIKKQYGFSFSIDEIVFEKPSVFLVGRQDASVGYKDAFAILDKFPRAMFAVLDKAGHNLQIEQPNIFHSMINEWLDRVESHGRC